MSNIDKQALRDSAKSTIGILENIAGFEPSDIDGDTVELRFETQDGFAAGCDVSIVDQCQKAADVIRALLDELEAVEHQNGYLREQCDEWERKAVSNFEECMEMTTRIEELESQRQMAFMAGNRWADKFREAEKRIAELEAIAKSLKFHPIPMEDLGNKSDGKKHPYMFGAGYNSAVVHCESVLLQAFSAAAGKGE